jgi:hypothetical protein
MYLLTFIGCEEAGVRAPAAGHRTSRAAAAPSCFSVNTAMSGRR